MTTARAPKTACVILPADVITAAPEFIAGHDLVYVGSEFCQNIFPSAADVRGLYRKGAKKVVLLSSFMTEKGLARVQNSFSAIIGEFPLVEVVLSDFGLLRYLNRRHPRTPKAIGRPLSIDFMRMPPAACAAFFRAHGLTRLETDEDDVLAGMRRKPGFAVSLHYPFRFVAMSRSCPFTRRITDDCGRKCYGKAFQLAVPGGELVADANAYFIRHSPRRPVWVDRLVRHYGDARG